MDIVAASAQDYNELLAVWEDSVRATHDFLTLTDIDALKPILMQQAFPSVNLQCIKDQQGAILGFIGVHNNKVDMLFVKDSARGRGIGKALLTHAMDTMKITLVDVNEQNLLARAFYERIGFHVISRSPVDDMGKPFPILHLQLSP